MNDAYPQGEFLTVEWDPKAERIEIHGTDEGLKRLVTRLSGLIGAKGNDHVHMMTSEWGGSDLSSEKQNPNAILANHVKILRWQSPSLRR